MEIESGTRAKLMYGIASSMLILGLLLNYFNLGTSNFAGFSSVGNWLIYLAFVGLMISTVIALSKKRRAVDERMEFISTKALRITFLSLFVASFIIMIIDGIKAITIPYHMFMSYLVCGLLIIYFITYKILLRFY
ncbi:hypothetical protein DRN85_04465 [Methanosarcinales archaeon]|nr:MAG: hypothetical protein DRN85_04465 [Methanosarcinales archaeon]